MKAGYAMQRSKRGAAHHLVWSLGLGLLAAAAQADQVTVKGTVLQGKITGFSAAGVVLETVYGKGALTIKWEDIEDLKSEGSFQVLYGDGEEAAAPLQGLSGGKVLVGGEPGAATPIDTAGIHSAVPIAGDALSWQDRVRSAWRYWDGSFDLAFSAQQATTDTNGFVLGFGTTRKHAPTRLILGGNYRYATQKQKGQSRQTIEDRAFGLIRGEYDLTPRLYGFASGDATYDAIQKLSIRGVPKAGLGYLLWEEQLDELKRNFLSAEAGGAWVYEGYFRSAGKDHTDYVAVAFGAAAGYHLPYAVHATWRLDYLPAVDDFANDYLLRNEAGLAAPLVDPVSAKFSLVNEYDNTPAPNTDRNSLYLALGLSVGW